MAMEKMMTAFNRRVCDLQELTVVRGSESYAATDLSALDVSLKAIENDFRTIASHVKSENEALLKAKALTEKSLEQEIKIQNLAEHFPITSVDVSDKGNHPPYLPASQQAQKVKKGKNVPPRRYISEEELASLSGYMRGRLTLDKVNSAVDEMAAYAETNTRLMAKKKLGDENMDKVLELRDVAANENIKGKYFFLETDMRGPLLKLDTTGKALVSILRHLGRILEIRIGRQRVFVLASGQ